MSYSQTNSVTGNITNALASQVNNLRAELKAAAYGMSTHDVDITITYNGGTGGDLPDTITYVDTQGDADLDLDAVTTITYTADLPTTITTVYSAMGITVTEVLTYTGDDVTSIATTLS